MRDKHFPPLDSMCWDLHVMNPKPSKDITIKRFTDSCSIQLITKCKCLSETSVKINNYRMTQSEHRHPYPKEEFFYTTYKRNVRISLIKFTINCLAIRVININCFGRYGFFYLFGTHGVHSSWKIYSVKNKWYYIKHKSSQDKGIGKTEGFLRNIIIDEFLLFFL